MRHHPPVRSLLFVPGNRPDLFPKAATAGAGALVLDLEDSVPPGAKDTARAAVLAELSRSPERLTLIRINSPEKGELEKDLSVLAPHGGQMIMAPKVTSPGDVEELDGRLAGFEKTAGLESQSIGVLVVIETALGLRNLFDTLRSTPRIRGAGLATAEEGDFMVDIGGRWSPSGEALAYARGKFVCDTRAAQADWLIDGAFMNLADEAALDQECRLARNHGFNSKVAIHPRQVKTINAAFLPTEAEVNRARELIEAFRAAEAEGRGAIRFQGMMVDYANVRQAEQVLAIAGQ